MSTPGGNGAGVVAIAMRKPASSTRSLSDLLCCFPDLKVPELRYDQLFRVLIVQFMDARSLDIRALKKSCIHLALPDGRSFSKSPSKGGWEAVTPANAEAEIITYRGTVGGGARFEVNFELDGDEIIGGGRIIDKAGVTNPLAFKLRIHMPDIYYFEKSTAKRANLAKKDRVDLLRADGKKLKLDLLTPLDAESQKINGTGMTKARVDLAGYKGGRFDFESGENATFEFWNKAEEPLIEGFALGWRPDPAKDRDGKARFTLKVR